MKRGAKIGLSGRRLHPVLSCFAAAVFSAASSFIAASDYSRTLPSALCWAVYACAAASLFSAVRAVALTLKTSDPKARLLEAAHRLPITGRMADDYSYRTVVFTYASFGANALLAVSKGIAGWLSSSAWLMTLAAYYLILCAAKLFLLKSGGRSGDETDRLRREWKAYRICGIMLMLLTVVTLGAVVLILKAGGSFSYAGVLIYVVAMYDFYCLISSVVYMVRTRKKHSPVVVAIKSVSFAASLVSMLSLQTAMFVSYGEKNGSAMQNMMNLITGSAVCLLLLALGLIMTARSGAKLAELRTDRSEGEI